MVSIPLRMRLLKKDGREYYECDIDTDGSYRGAVIMYTEDENEISVNAHNKRL